MVQKTLYVMQGVPGSGKSTVAKALGNALGIQVYSTDDFFVRDGCYRFEPTKLKEYHALNFQRTQAALAYGYSVILDNTNTKRWHVRPYVECATSLGCNVVFIRVTGDFPNVHGVPKAVVDRMRAEMETLDVQSVLDSVVPDEVITSVSGGIDGR